MLQMFVWRGSWWTCAWGCRNLWVSQQLTHLCLVRDAVPAQLLLLQVGLSLQVGSSDPNEDMQGVPAQVLLWEGWGETGKAGAEQQHRLRQRLCVAPLRAAGKPWWGYPWRWKGPRGQGKRDTHFLLVLGCAKCLSGSPGPCCSHLSCVIWQQGFSTLNDSMQWKSVWYQRFNIVVNSQQKIRWTRKGKLPLETTWKVLKRKKIQRLGRQSGLWRAVTQTVFSDPI